MHLVLAPFARGLTSHALIRENQNGNHTSRMILLRPLD